MYKLSIIIPTYNGGGWIEDTIRSVVYQLKDYKDLVELFIRDNASTDETPAIVEKVNNEYENIIHYERRESNTDADTNFREAVLLTSSEYVLLLGDDDLLFPNYVKYTLDLLNSNPNIGLIYYNRICTTRDYEGAKLKHLNPCPTFERYYDNTENFINDHLTGPDFMSVNVVKRECLLKGLSHSKVEYYGVEWYYSMLYGLQGHKCLSLFTPMILQRLPVNRFWTDKILLYVGVGMDNLFKDLSLFYPTIYLRWREHVSNNIPMLSYIINGIPRNRKMYKEKWDELKVKLNKGQRFVAYVLINYPIFTKPIQLLCRLYLKFK